ncbi:MAG: hypothetical protein FWE55_00685 [Synergistaceae bacterium]|nr:hypothetical protein [Synergistaceae bacterium]
MKDLPGSKLAKLLAKKIRPILRRLKNRFGWWNEVAALLLAAVIVVALVRQARVPPPAIPQHDLLEIIPAPEQGYPAAVITALQGEFPLGFARLMTNSASSPDKIPAGSAFIPIFNSAQVMALVVTKRAQGPVIYGVFVPTLEEYDLLRSGVLPAEWGRNFDSPSMRQTDRRNLYRLLASGDPVYLLAEDELVFVSDSVNDVNRIMDVRNGVAGGIRRKWSQGPEAGGHAFFSDGGLISAMIKGDETGPNPREAVELEVAWVTSGDVNTTHAHWQVSGMEYILPRAFLNDIKPYDWSKNETFIPDPLVLAFGVNLPNPGRSMTNIPFPLKYFADQLRDMGLRNSETQAILTGPATFSIGGRTQILWYDLPGIAIDIPGRGDIGLRMIDKFWSEMFVDAEPEPIQGYSNGGVTNLPFTILAAANEDHALLGLVPSDSDQNYEVSDLLWGVTSAAAWMYVDFPGLGTSLLEIPALNSMIYEEDEEGTLDEESADNLNKALSALGSLFIKWETATAGSAICYY